MNKTELIKEIAGATKLTIKDVTAVIDSSITVITKSLVKGDEVAIAGFGKFVSKKRAARISINPRTKQKIKVAASKAVGFKVGKALKDAVNKR